MLQYCVESVLFLAQHWAQTDADWDYLSLIRWMMQHADIDTVLWYYDREELTHFEDMPTLPQGPQGCIRLHGGVEKCAPDGGWPKYYPIDEEELSRSVYKFLTRRIVGYGMGKIIPNKFVAVISGWVVAQPLVEAIDKNYENEKSQSLNVTPNLPLEKTALVPPPPYQPVWQEKVSSHFPWDRPPLVYTHRNGR